MKYLHSQLASDSDHATSTSNNPPGSTSILSVVFIVLQVPAFSDYQNLKLTPSPVSL